MQELQAQQFSTEQSTGSIECRLKKGQAKQITQIIEYLRKILIVKSSTESCHRISRISPDLFCKITLQAHSGKNQVQNYVT